MALIDFSSVGSGLLNIALTLALIVIGALVVFGVFKFLEYQNRYKQFTVVIWDKDSFNQIHQTYDKGGIFIDKKTNDKRLWLKKGKVGLECNDVPYITGPKGQKIIFLIKTGSKNYRYIKPKFVDGQAMLTVGEEDVNWALYSYKKQKEVFGTNTLMQYLPYIALIIVAVIIMVIFIYFFKNFEVLRDVANAFQNAATELAKYHGQNYNSTLIVG